MKKDTRKLKLERTTLKNLTSTTLALVGGGGSANGGSVDGGNSGCGCGNSWQDTCVRTL